MMETFQLLPWQQKDWHFLNSYIEQERIPQALLITGTSGMGKQKLAIQFASALLCAQPQDNGLCCGLCHSCQLINAETHPDLISIKPDEDKKSISINQIRHVVADTYLKPQFETHRVIVINPADVMTASAVNSFLKCLEEPTERTVFILITNKPYKLPATIISRCQKLSVTLPDKDKLHDWLTRQGIYTNQETLLNLLRASILTIPQLSNPDYLKLRTECFNDWLKIANHTNHPAIIAEKWQKLPEADLINWLISWLTDVVKCAFHINPVQICNQDFVKHLQELSQQLELKGLYRLYGLLLNHRQQLGTQINFQIMLEEILVQWQELNRRH
jgi:DNA polymerase III subunit delta'